MEKCQHFTIREAVAEFRKRDRRLNYPLFPAHHELNSEHINPLLHYPLDTPKFKWWCCKSCVQDLVEGDCPLQLDEPGNSSYSELVTWKDSSGADAAIVNSSVALDAYDPQLLNCSIIENGGAKEEFEDSQTSADHATNSGLLIPEKHRVMFDLNELPTSETSEQKLEFDDLVNEEFEFEKPYSETTKLLPEHKPDTENTEPPEAVVPIASGDMENSNRHFSPEIETYGSFLGSDHNVILKEDASKKKRSPKYRALSELLNSKAGENSEDGQSNSTMEIDQGPDPKPYEKSKPRDKMKKKQLRIRMKLSSTRSSKNKDAAGSNVKNRVIDFNVPVEKYHSSLDNENLQRSRVQRCKRKHGESLVRDNTNKRGNADSQNGTGHLLLPKKRIQGDKVLKLHSHIDKPLQLESAAVKRMTIHGRPSGHKRLKLDAPGKDFNKRMLGAQKKKKNTCNVSGRDTEQRNPNKRPTIAGNRNILLLDVDKSIPSLHCSNKKALTGIHLLSMAAAETGDIDLLSERGADRANMPMRTQGCVQSMYPFEFVTVDEAMKSFMLGPENFPLRNDRTAS